MKLVSRIVIC